MTVPSIVSHRGGACVHSENSLEAFAWSARSGFCEVEFDVHCTLDGKLVVFHDLQLHQAADAVGVIGEKTLAELTATRLRGTDGTIPSLESVLETLKDFPIGLRIELKTDFGQNPYAGMLERLVDAIDRHGVRDRSVISSFEPDALNGFAEAGFPTALWYAKAQKPSQPDILEWIPELKRRRFRDIAVHFKEFSNQRLSDLRDAGFRVGVWTVNGPARLDFWLRQPIDFVVSDQPEIAARVRNHLLNAASGA